MIINKVIGIVHEEQLKKYPSLKVFMNDLKKTLNQEAIPFYYFGESDVWINESRCDSYNHRNLLILPAEDYLRIFSDTDEGSHKPLSIHDFNILYTFVYSNSNLVDVVEKSLKMGADDYLDLNACPILNCLRVKHTLSKINTHTSSRDQNTSYDYFQIDPFSKQIIFKQQLLDLTQSEYCLFYTLAKNPHRVFPMEYLFQMISGQKSCGDYNALMTQISRLRKKLTQVDDSHAYIVNVRNQGYQFRPKESLK